MNTNHKRLTFIRSVWQQFWILDSYLIIFKLYYQIAPFNFVPCIFITFYIFLKEKISKCNTYFGLSSCKNARYLLHFFFF